MIFIRISNPISIKTFGPVGEESIQKMIVNFLDRKGSDYKTDRNFPGLTATSMMSPYINSGVVSSKWCLNQLQS